MEEMLIYLILLCGKLVTENEYNKRLDELFFITPENDDLLYFIIILTLNNLERF